MNQVDIILNYNTIVLRSLAPRIIFFVRVFYESRHREGRSIVVVVNEVAVTSVPSNRITF